MSLQNSYVMVVFLTDLNLMNMLNRISLSGSEELCRNLDPTALALALAARADLKKAMSIKDLSLPRRERHRRGWTSTGMSVMMTMKRKKTIATFHRALVFVLLLVIIRDHTANLKKNAKVVVVVAVAELRVRIMIIVRHPFRRCHLPVKLVTLMFVVIG